mgnify:CR=1 FL=1
MSRIMLHLYPDQTVPGREERLRAAALAFAAALGRPEPDLTLARGAYGKPYFPQAPWLHFSISHSGDYWLLGLGCSQLGVDIQQKRPVDHQALARRWFTPAEAAYVAQGGREAFYAVWSAREAYLKLLGCGLDNQDQSVSVVRDGQLLKRLGDTELISLPLLEGYAVCLACAGGPLEVIRHDC